MGCCSDILLVRKRKYRIWWVLEVVAFLDKPSKHVIECADLVILTVVDA